MSTDFSCYASAAFGMEGLVSEELKRLRLRDVTPENGGVRFTASLPELYRCNLMMHFSDRLFVILAEGSCKSFEQLFSLVGTVAWQDYIAGDESIDILAKCVRSVLMSPRDCQSITKKAIIEKLKQNSGQRVFPENGPSFPVLVSVRNDLVRILLNTSGDALSRRGYRTWNGEAPLRETLAAALVSLSPWRPGFPLHDPCCGTGTILIEAALMAANRAPGLKRSFMLDSSRRFRLKAYSDLRAEADAETDWSRISDISGSDINPDALKLADRHMAQAGLPAGRIELENCPLQTLHIPKENGTFICNPPYGERLSDQKHARELIHGLSDLKRRHVSWHLCAISSDPAFEPYFGKRADKKRRLYNGRLECVYYIYY